MGQGMHFHFPEVLHIWMPRAGGGGKFRTLAGFRRDQQGERWSLFLARALLVSQQREGVVQAGAPTFGYVCHLGDGKQHAGSTAYYQAGPDEPLRAMFFRPGVPIPWQQGPTWPEAAPEAQPGEAPGPGGDAPPEPRGFPDVPPEPGAPRFLGSSPMPAAAGPDATEGPEYPGGGLPSWNFGKKAVWSGATIFLWTDRTEGESQPMGGPWRWIKVGYAASPVHQSHAMALLAGALRQDAGDLMSQGVTIRDAYGAIVYERPQLGLPEGVRWLLAAYKAGSGGVPITRWWREGERFSFPNPDGTDEMPTPTQGPDEAGETEGPACRIDEILAHLATKDRNAAWQRLASECGVDLATLKKLNAGLRWKMGENVNVPGARSPIPKAAPKKSKKAPTKGKPRKGGGHTGDPDDDEYGPPASDDPPASDQVMHRETGDPDDVPPGAQEPGGGGSPPSPNVPPEIPMPSGPPEGYTGMPSGGRRSRGYTGDPDDEPDADQQSDDGCATAAAAGSRRRVLTKADHGRTIDVGAGDQVRIKLEEVSGTPFFWEMSMDKGVTLVSDTTEGGDPDAPGASYWHVFVVSPSRSGRFAVRAKLWASFSGEVAERFAVTLRAS